MTNAFIDPHLLPLVPPMDLNSSARGVDKISPFPMQLRTRANVGLFGARRETDTATGLIRMHQGIDLLAPKGTKVFAAAGGKVISAGASSVTILHQAGIWFFTRYVHLFNVVVQTNDDVTPGQLLGEVDSNANWIDETHLHFEIRYPFDNAAPTVSDSLAINAAFAMYHWEVKSFQNDKDRNVIDNVHISSFEEIVRGRQLRFIMINVEGTKRDLFLPLQAGLPEDDCLANTLREAFMIGKKVRIVWRGSLFFSKIQTEHSTAGIIAEIKVYR